MGNHGLNGVKSNATWQKFSRWVWAMVWFILAKNLILLGLDYLFNYSQNGVLWLIIFPFPLVWSHLFFGVLAFYNGVMSLLQKEYDHRGQIQSILIWTLATTLYKSLQYMEFETDYIFSSDQYVFVFILLQGYLIPKKKLRLKTLLTFNRKSIILIIICLACTLLPSLYFSYRSFEWLHS